VSLRDELMELGEAAIEHLEANAHVPILSADLQHVEAVLDSIPPNTFKNERGEWVRLERCGSIDEVGYLHGSRDGDDAERPVYTEADR
jgi:hypothetical protein